MINNLPSKYQESFRVKIKKFFVGIFKKEKTDKNIELPKKDIIKDEVLTKTSSFLTVYFIFLK